VRSWRARSKRDCAWSRSRCRRCESAVGADEPVAAVPETPETLLVWRQDVAVYHRPVDPDEEVLLAMVAARARFDAVCE